MKNEISIVFTKKRKLSIAYLMLLIASLIFGCHQPAKDGSNNNLAASPISFGEKYNIDTKASVITWKGSMVYSFDEGNIGYVHISKGELVIEKSKLVGGTVEIDMNTIEYKDKTDTNTPVKYLKSPDFFDVEKFPVSTFAITKVESVNARSNTIKVSGNLTIKGVTNPVTFPAQMTIKDGIVNANGKITIDRTQWGIRYRSGKFYDNLADNAVSDDIELLMKVVAKK